MIEFLRPDKFRHLREFDSHRLIARVIDPPSQLHGFIVIHRGGNQSPALGATRLWPYSSPHSALKDALRLSRIMTYKSALSGLKYGGAKGVLIQPPAVNAKQSADVRRRRRQLFYAYAEGINHLDGQFITGTDVGLSDMDLKLMSKKTSFLLGFQSQPAKYTAIGLLLGIETCLKEVFGTPEIDGRTFSLQGLGKVGSELLRRLYRRAAKIFVTDINSQRLREIKRKFPNVVIVSPDKIFNIVVDVYSPCAVSGIITSTAARSLRAKIVAGGGNDQLSKPEVGQLLYQRGVLYAPDYVINAGGLISVADELEHQSSNANRVLNKLLRIRRNLMRIFKLSREKDEPPELVAEKMAKKLIKSKFG